MSDVLQYRNWQWDTADDCLDELITMYASAYLYTSNLQTALETAWESFGGGDDHTALNWVLICLGNIQPALFNMLARSSTYIPHYNLPYYLKNYAGEVTYKSICEAWAKDDFEGRAVTIAFIDRMRQLIWNEPFSAIWAARPEKEF